MKRTLLTFGFVCSAALMWAQTDMTNRIVNPGFEDEREGWEIHGFGCQSNTAFTQKEGKIYLETWRPAGDRAMDARVLQVIKNLPAGSYTVSCVAQNIQQNQATAKQTGVWLYANDDITQVNLPKRYTVNTVVVDGTLTIGFTAENATGNYVCVDAFTLTQNEPDEHTYEVFRAEMVKMVEKSDALNQHTGTTQQAVLDAATADAKAVIAGTSTKDVAQVFITLRDAIEAYHFSIATPANPLDVTSRIENPSFENSTKFWTCDGFSSQTNDAFPLKVGTTYIERYGWERAEDAYAYQDVTLPNGNYHLTVKAQNILQSSSNAKQQGAWICGGTQQKLIQLPGTYEMDFTVVDGMGRIALKVENCTGNYVCFDDIHLYYTGMDEAAQMEVLKQMITAGEIALALPQSAETKAALTKALANAKLVTSPEDMTDVASALTDATRAAEESNKVYAVVGAAITQAEAIYASADGNQGEAFKKAIDDLKAQYNAGTIDVNKVDSAIIAMDKEGILYLAAHGTGEVPEVITYNFVPEGATGALGRLKVKGISASKIKMQGFCWALHKEPTLKDNFTAMGEKLYDYPGLIYVMEPLEPATEYYVRAFAMTTDNQVGYGQVRRIITLPKGQCTWHYAYNGEEADNQRLAAAAEGAMYYYNNWTNIVNYGINVNFDPGDESAHCSYGGWMTVGPNAGYQKIGTVMHESGHGIGQGQIWQWSWAELKGDTQWVPENLGEEDGGPTGGEIVNTTPGEGVWWQGERSNMMVYFLTDGRDFANGDWGHCGPFGVNGAGADNGTRILYIANALEIHGMGEDGMPPSGGSASPYYSFRSIDSTLYYISNEAYGGGLQYLTETATGALKSVKASSDEVLKDSAYAWNIIFQPQTCYYLIRNAKSGKYFSFKSGTIKSTTIDAPGASESFHLMPSRYYARFGKKDAPVKHKGYWIIEGNRNVWCAPALEGATNGSVSTKTQVFENKKTEQRWLLLTAAEARNLANELGSVDKEKLERYIAGARDMLTVPHTDLSDGATAALTDVVERIDPTLPTLNDATQISSDLTATTTAITTFMTATTPDDLKAYDLTFMLENADLTQLDESKQLIGWVNEGATVAPNEDGIIEIDAKAGSFNLYQTLAKMPKGVYGMTTQGFERPGTLYAANKAYSAGDNNVSTNMYLRSETFRQTIKHIMMDAQPEEVGVGQERSSNSGYVPNNMAAVVGYFAKGLYNNLMAMQMTIKTDMKVGIRNPEIMNNSMIMFTAPRLYYYGDKVTPEEVTSVAAPEGVTVEGSDTYDLTGRKVTSPTKGLYIRGGKTYIKK